MSLEPSIADLVLAEDSPVVATDWSAYQKCIVCRVEMGQPCVTRYGRIEDGRTEGGPQQMIRAHGHRKRRHGR